MILEAGKSEICSVHCMLETQESQCPVQVGRQFAGEFSLAQDRLAFFSYPGF